MIIHSRFGTPIATAESGWHEFVSMDQELGFSFCTDDEIHRHVANTNPAFGAVITAIEGDYRDIYGLSSNEPLAHDILMRSGITNENTLMRTLARSGALSKYFVRSREDTSETQTTSASFIHIDDPFFENFGPDQQAMSYALSDADGSVYYQQRFWLPSGMPKYTTLSAAAAVIGFAPQVVSRGRQARPNTIIRFNPHTDAHNKPINGAGRTFLRDSVTRA
jgi:hypothetical protein